MKSKERLEILDFYRFIAILMVMLFHFFSRWTIPNNTINLYPYLNKYDFFKLGKNGVHFFFMISGFVIFLSLEKSKNIKDFLKNRSIRLIPSMLLISSFTFIIFKFFDNNFIFPDAHKLSNLFFSWSFIQPGLFNNFKYIDSSYWSLWVEIQFYIMVAILYFISKINKWDRYFIYIFMFISLGLIFLSESYSFWLIWQNIILFQYIKFFIIGMIFWKLYSLNNDSILQKTVLHSIILIWLLSELLYFTDDRYTKILVICFLILFYILIFYKRLNFNENIFWRKTVLFGKSSYISYLFHQNAGVLLINKINYSGQYAFLIPLATIFLFFFISNYILLKYEVEIVKLLKL
jgi:peptidoglycan/LPS O-acetylase OafA/YrhL